MLKITNLTKTFGSRTILDNVTLEIKTGTISVLLGASGVGKSTLLRILSDLETPTKGSVTFDGQPLKKLQSSHSVGMVFQQFNLFEHLSVEENITLALCKVQNKTAQEAQAVAHKLLKQYGLLEKKDTYAVKLSGGQKQRLAIARALAMQPRVICFDEPTSALDPRLTTHVAQNIQDLAQKGLTVLVATHDVSLLEQLDCTIYLMDAGKIIETTQAKAYYQTPQNFSRIHQFVTGKTIE